MANFKPITARNMNECLSTHPMYQTAKLVMKERLPGLLDDDVCINTYSIVYKMILWEWVEQGML